MKKLQQEKREFVRILIGKAETGSSGIKAPTKTINIESDSVEEVYNEINSSIEKEIK